MRSRGGVTLFRILFILVVFCRKYSDGLKCYSCLDPVSYCNATTTCSSSLDACLISVSMPRIYHQCWMFSNCNFEAISKRLGESNLEFRCCQKDLCNLKLEKTEKENDQEKNGTAILSGKTTLLVLLLLVISWNCFL